MDRFWRYGDTTRKDDEPVLKRKRLLLAVGTLAAVAGMLIAMLLLGPSGPEKAEPSLLVPQKIRLGLPLQPSNALMLIAVENGYLEDEGLQIEVTGFPSGKRALRDGLFTGAVDAIVASDAPLAVAATERRDFRIIATTFKADNVNRIVARRDAGIVVAGDLRGKRIATQRSSAVHFFLYLFLLENGIVQEDIRPVFMKAGELPRALADGRIDAFSMREPYVSEARALLGRNAVVFESPGLYRQTDQLVASLALVEHAPQVVDALIRALVRAETFAREQQDSAIRLVAARLGVEAAPITALWPKTGVRLTLNRSLLLLLETEIRWLARSGFPFRLKAMDHRSLIDARALSKVYPVAVSLDEVDLHGHFGGTDAPMSTGTMRTKPGGQSR